MLKAKLIPFIFLSAFLPLFSQEDHKVFVTHGIENELEIFCTLEEFGSVYRISKFFNQSVDEILKINKLNTSDEIRAEQRLKIDFDKSRISSKKSKGSIPLYYKVQDGETLYRIARTYLGQDINEFIERNDLISHTLKKDDILNIGYYPVNNIPEQTKSTVAMEVTTLVSKKDTVADKKNEIEETEVTYIKQKGIAIVNGKNSGGEGGLFVLHSEAKLNSEIEVYNPMRGRTVKAKVVGRIPEGRYTSDVNVVLSSATAKSLGALDNRFRVEIKYIQ